MYETEVCTMNGTRLPSRKRVMKNNSKATVEVLFLEI